jgi:hypothetical protein
VVVLGRCLGDRSAGAVAAVVDGPKVELGCGAVDRSVRHAGVVQWRLPHVPILGVSELTPLPLRRALEHQGGEDTSRELW